MIPPPIPALTDRSLAAIEEALTEYPSIQIVIDVHRDSILTDDGRAYKTSCTIDGEEMAQLMFVVGTDDGGLNHPDWRDNLNYVASLQYKLNRTYPRPDAAGQPAHPAL